MTKAAGKVVNPDRKKCLFLFIKWAILDKQCSETSDQ